MSTTFYVFGLSRQGIEPGSTAAVTDALSTQPLNGYLLPLSSTNWPVDKVVQKIYSRGPFEGP